MKRIDLLKVVTCTALLCVLFSCRNEASVSGSNSKSERPLEERISEVAQPVVDNGWTQGLVIGVTQNGEDKYFSFGALAHDDSTPPDENTVFEIGSITKVFTAIVLADMATKQELALGDPISKFLSEDVNVPSPGGEPITLESLAAHTSGLPVIPANFWKQGDVIHDSNVAGLRWREYSQAQIREFFEKPAPPMDQSRKYVYSNLGVGLLGHALEKISGESIDDLILKRVCKPLGMDATSFTIEPSAKGHNADGVPVDYWSKGDSVLAGAFALRSTCRDMLAFAKANLSPASSSIAESLKLAQTAIADINEIEKTALGWKRNKYGVIYTTGATGGFRCAMFLHPDTKTAVVTMANSQVGGVTGGRAGQFDTLAGSLLNVTLGAPPIPLDLPAPTSEVPDNLEDYIGGYRPQDGSQGPSFPIRVEDGKLMTVGPGQVDARLWPKAKDQFFLRSYTSDIHFLRSHSGAVTGGDLTFEGTKVQLKKFDE